MTAVAAPRPVSAVLGAIRSGSVTTTDVQRATGLPRDVVEAALDHLARLGRLRSEPLQSGCPATGCGQCPVASSDGPGCGRAAGSPPRRSGLLMSLPTP